MPEPEIAIRPAVTPADYLACQQAQRLAWGIVDDAYLVPVATMVGAQLHGGLVLGAFRADGSAVGLSFAFLGRVGDRPCLYSQLTGVIPGFQGSGIGGRLKDFQRRFARERGLPCLAWAFDPFRPGNARFNLARLGARARHYHVDLYGPRTDALNAGAPTDRLIAEWDVDPDGSTPPDLGPARRIEIPADLATLRRVDPAAAAAEVDRVRRAFAAAFAAGDRADGFESTPDGRHAYLLNPDPGR